MDRSNNKFPIFEAQIFSVIHPQQQSSIFLTGATGFVGSWLVRHFAERGFYVLASGRAPRPPELPGGVDYLRADLRAPVPPVSAAAAVHCAALASDTAAFSDLLAVNVEGARQVFYATERCPVLVYISSSSVYDYRQELHREDEAPLLRRGSYPLLSPYGRSKRLAEDWLLAQDWRRRALVVLRPRAVYGPGDRVLLPRLLRLVRAGRLFLPGDLNVPSSLTYAGNLAAAVERSLDFARQRGAGAHIFNVADAEPYRLREVVEALLAAVYGKQLPVRVLPLGGLRLLGRLLDALPRENTLSRFGLDALSKPCALDLGRSRAELGYRPQRTFWEVLPEIGAWAQAVGRDAICGKLR